MLPDLPLARLAWGWSLHASLGKHPIAYVSTRDNSYCLEVPFALRTRLKNGELDGCASLDSFSAPLAHELDDRGHRTSLSGRRA